MACQTGYHFHYISPHDIDGYNIAISTVLQYKNYFHNFCLTVQTSLLKPDFWNRLETDANWRFSYVINVYYTNRNIHVSTINVTSKALELHVAISSRMSMKYAEMGEADLQKH